MRSDERCTQGPGATTESDVLVLDAHTLKDLEVFESDTGGASLFDLCNQTCNEGGAAALRRRMQSPWSSAVRIKATQESLAFILAERRAFETLPSLAYTTGRVQYYLDDILRLVTR
jgi:DNA mismatch repair ATPase MutS